LTAGEDELYFAFMEHEGQIELNHWAKTKKEAEDKAKEWAKFSAERGEQNVSFGVAKIIENVEYNLPKIKECCAQSNEKGEGKT
jgi:hypothetical protein